MAEQMAELNKSVFGVFQSETITEKGITIIFYKMGDLKAFSFTNGTLTSSVNDYAILFTFPVGYEPQLSGQIAETVGASRFSYDTQGIRAVGNKTQGQALRGVFVYF